MDALPLTDGIYALILLQDAGEVAESPETNVGNIIQGVLIALLLLAAAYAVARRVFPRRRR